MKPSKIQAMDEAGRSMAEKRYGAIAEKSDHGHREMDQNLRGKYDTPMPAANQTSRVEAPKQAKHVSYPGKGE